MASARESELTLINFIIKEVSIFKENESNLKSFPFEYPYSKDIYSIVTPAIKKHGQAPTLIEAKRLGEKLSDKRNHTSIQRGKLQDDLDYTYLTASTSSSGDVFADYIFKQGAKELANKLLVSTPEDFKKHYSELKDKLDSLSSIETKSEPMGVSLMSKTDITECMTLIESVNTQECIATGFRAWDRHLLGGFRPGEVAMVMAGTGVGKAQPLSSLILTPEGFVKMGEAYVGMDICNTLGGVSQVTAVWPQGVKPIYEITFSDKTKARCCDDHLWSVQVKAKEGKKRFKTKALKEFRDRLFDREGSSLYKIPIVNAVTLNSKEVPVDPYLLGLLLGDGCVSSKSVRYCSIDDELIESVRRSLPYPVTMKRDMAAKSKAKCYGLTIDREEYGGGYIKCNPLINSIRDLKLWGTKSTTKFVPDVYKHNVEEVRLSVLQGLMDTDGCIDWANDISFNTCSLQLAQDVAFLYRSLGGVATFRKTVYPKHGNICYRLGLRRTNKFNPFRLKRKSDKYLGATTREASKFIKEVTLVGEEVCQCITTNAPDSCYITDDFIVTHNTAFLLNIAHNNAVDMNKRVVYITMDNQVEECAERFFANWLKKPIGNNKNYSDMHEELLDRVKVGSEHNFILQAWHPQRHTPQDIIRYINKLQEKFKIYDYDHGVPVERCGHIDLIMIDYLEKLLPTQKTELYRQALFQIADECVVVAKTFKCPVILASQANKESMKAETSQITMAGESYAKLHPCAHVMILSMSDDERLSVPSRFKVINGKNRRSETNYAVPMIFDRYTQSVREDPDRPIIALNSTLRTDASASQHGVDRAQAVADGAAEVARMYNNRSAMTDGNEVEVERVSLVS